MTDVGTAVATLQRGTRSYLLLFEKEKPASFGAAARHHSLVINHDNCTGACGACHYHRMRILSYIHHAWHPELPVCDDKGGLPA